MKFLKHFYLRTLVVATLLFQLSACKTQNLFQSAGIAASDSAAFSIGSEYQYRIRRDDKISISIWDHDDLSVGSSYGIYNSNEVYGKWLMVDAKGSVNVPKIGSFHIKDMTVIEAKDSMEHLFATWIKNPVIDIKVLNKEIVMLGELKTPGKILLEKDINNLVEMIGKAGDFDFYANKERIKIIRNVDNHIKEINIDLTKMDKLQLRNVQLIPGDIVYVPSKKGKDFDKRVSVIIPFVSAITAFAITYKAFF